MHKKAFLFALALCSLSSVYGQHQPAPTGKPNDIFLEETAPAQQKKLSNEQADNFFIEEDSHMAEEINVANAPAEAALKPARAIPANLLATNISEKSAVLHWAAVPGVNSYDVRVKSAGSTTWTTFNRLSSFAQVSGFKPGTTYEYQVRSNMANSSSPFSASTYFTTSATPASVSYCKSSGTEATQAWINKVQLASINNTSGLNNGYGNFTNLATDLIPGKSYTVYVTPGFEGKAQKENWKVWIDYNNNGSFEDGSELVMEKTTHNNHTHSASFTVPYHTKAGKVRMRVAMKANSFPGACETFANGEVEDYTINIVNNPAHAHASSTGHSHTAEQNDLKVFPNPTRDYTTLSANLAAHNGPVALQVFDAQGRVVLTRYYAEGTRHLTEQLNLSDQPAGSYYIKIVTGNTSMVRKLVLTHKSTNVHL